MTDIRQAIEEGTIRLGMTKAEVRQLLGPPDDWGNTSRKYREPSIWLYRQIEIWFERRPYRTPFPGPPLIGVYTEDEDDNGELLL
jgi:hypothetical protein